MILRPAVLGLLLAFVVAGFLAVGAPEVVSLFAPSHAVRAAIESELEASPGLDEYAEFYRDRDFQPVWVESRGVWPFWVRSGLRPEAAQLLRQAASVGSRPAAASAAARAARDGEPGSLARSELALSVLLVDYVRQLRAPVPAARLAFVDPDLARSAEPTRALAELANAPSLGAHLNSLATVNPVFQALAQGLTAYRAAWSALPQLQVPQGPTLRPGDESPRVALLRRRLGLSGNDAHYDVALQHAVLRFQSAHGLPPGGEVDAATLAALNAGAGLYERLILANLERARALPPSGSRRYIVVNVAAGELRYFQDGQEKGAMPVVVGTTREQTPMMAGMLRYLAFQPYWDVPVDLVRTALAPKVLRLGPGYFRAQHMQALSDWSDAADVIAPEDVDWRAVAGGEEELRVRQLPGADNMMGAVKFMLPNELGIYLHDTPDKRPFKAGPRLLSAGCIRLADAAALARWLTGRTEHPSGPEARVDLDQPVPVYITYLTAAPAPGGVTFYPDVYGRDPALLSEMPR